MSVAVVSRRGRTGWYATRILVTVLIGSGLVAFGGVAWQLARGIVGRPTGTIAAGRENETRVMLDHEFERLISVHYEEEHARTVRNHSSRYDTKVNVLRIFVKHADGPKLMACIALTDELIEGFCPKDLTDRVADLDQYKGPWGSKNLNAWVKGIEDLEVRALIRRAGEQVERTKPVDWWILFCGTVEQYETERTKRCLDDWGAMPGFLKPAANMAISNKPHLFIAEVPLGPRLLDERLKNLRAYMRELSDIFCDVHAVYARRHVDFVRSLYNEWCLNSGPLPGGFEGRVEGYVRNLLEERGVEVEELKAAGGRPPADERSTGSGIMGSG